MTNAQTLTTTVYTNSPARDVSVWTVLRSPLRAQAAYSQFCKIKRLDARQLDDVGMTAAQRDAMTFAEVFATV